MHTKIFILFVALSLGVPVISASDVFRFGIVAYHVPFDSYKLVEEDFDRIAGNGIDWISVDFAWRDLEKEKGSYDFSYFDYVVENAEKRGITILAKVGNGYNGTGLWCLNGPNRSAMKIITELWALTLLPLLRDMGRG